MTAKWQKLSCYWPPFDDGTPSYPLHRDPADYQADHEEGTPDMPDWEEWALLRDEQRNAEAFRECYGNEPSWDTEPPF